MQLCATLAGVRGSGGSLFQVRVRGVFLRAILPPKAASDRGTSERDRRFYKIHMMVDGIVFANMSLMSILTES